MRADQARRIAFDADKPAALEAMFTTIRTKAGEGKYRHRFQTAPIRALDFLRELGYDLEIVAGEAVTVDVIVSWS
jgi:hypothetical protein